MRVFDAASTRAALPFGRLIPALRALFAAGCTMLPRHVHEVTAPEGGADWRLRNGTLRAKHNEQVPERRAVIGPVVLRVSSARAARQVVVKEDGDRDFVDPGQRQPPGADPAREVRHLSEVAGNGVCGVPALGQVTLERGNVRPDGTGEEPIDLDDAQVLSGIHGDLQKWDHQCAPMPKLCPVRQMTVPPNTAPMLPPRDQRRVTCA